MDSIGLNCKIKLFAKERSYLRLLNRLIAHYKDILLYLDDCHLSFCIGIETKKVDGGKSGVQREGENRTENFFLPWALVVP